MPVSDFQNLQVRPCHSQVGRLGLLLVVLLLTNCRNDQTDKEFARAFREIREGDSREVVLQRLAPWQFVIEEPILEGGSTCGPDAISRLSFISSEGGRTGLVSLDRAGKVSCTTLLSRMRKHG